MNKDNFWKIIIVPVILIGLLAGGWFFIRNKPTEESEKQNQSQIQTQETSDWKTYRNEEFGFELKYPSEYKFETNNNVPVDDLVFDAFLLRSAYRFQISKTNNNDINTWYLDWRDNFLEGEQDFESGVIINPHIDYLKDIKIGTVAAKEVRIKGMPYADTKFYFIRNNYLYEFSYDGLRGKSSVVNEKYEGVAYYWEKYEYKKEIEQLREPELVLFKKFRLLLSLLNKTNKQGFYLHHLAELHKFIHTAFKSLKFAKIRLVWYD